MALILIVEDDTEVGVLFVTLLEAAGFDVLRETTGSVAVTTAVERRPDLVILDVSLGGDIDGYTVASRLRAHPGTATTPIMMVTARAREEDHAAGIAAGADDYVRKPFDIDDLLLRIEKLLTS